MMAMAAGKIMHPTGTTTAIIKSMAAVKKTVIIMTTKGGMGAMTTQIITNTWQKTLKSASGLR